MSAGMLLCLAECQRILTEIRKLQTIKSFKPSEDCEKDPWHKCFAPIDDKSTGCTQWKAQVLKRVHRYVCRHVHINVYLYTHLHSISDSTRMAGRRHTCLFACRCHIDWSVHVPFLPSKRKCNYYIREIRRTTAGGTDLLAGREVYGCDRF